ncbi:tetratricopeptide repeat protein [Alterisphingorhabdus coralli]|uniref:Tetratricopeptide repeat protein n=1 Tax=Alterisphingorhabdus coralli TaxID=3071408 RepID=A0AA97I0I8_9SPHN|nr:tetratricopeptide repeat protein [Parasphingorhabdus sp. SCSIO 66989]WOE75002.1 tetratricopeptide repeat protein [Parasphingorhabdus sp. SCSIO 66989]
MPPILKTALALGLVVAIPATAPLYAAGSRSSPSQSTPQYDAAEEYQKGVKALEKADYRKAEKAFKRSLRVAPEDANTQYMLGVTYMRTEQFGKAVKRFERAVNTDADMVLAHRDLAIAYVQLDEQEKAQKVLGQMKALQAECREDANCAEMKDLDEAVMAVESELAGGGGTASYGPYMKVLADASRGDALYSDAIALINQQRYAEALEHLDDAALAFGPHPDILTYQGFANRKLKRFDVAEGYYGRALALAPEHRGAWEYYGELKLERGDMAGAKQHLARLESLCSFGCYEADELGRWIAKAEAQSSAL